MTNREVSLNELYLNGVFDKDFEYSHSVFNEKFYKNYIRIQRASGTDDILQVIVSEYTLKDTKSAGKRAGIKGSFRSRNVRGDGKSKLDLYVLISQMNLYEGDLYRIGDNLIFLEGWICKKTFLRLTPNGRKICDFFLAVNAKIKTYYFPCIAWGDTAENMSKEFCIGDKVKTKARIQSREYLKVIEDKPELRTAYEISVIEIEKM